jgi:hypothetical protein
MIMLRYGRPVGHSLVNASKLDELIADPHPAREGASPARREGGGVAEGALW